MRNRMLRYYLRGLGIGILVTAVILGIAGKDTEPMSDAVVRERAAQLGMVDSNSLVLSELQKRDETPNNSEMMSGSGADSDRDMEQNTDEDTDAVVTEETESEAAVSETTESEETTEEITENENSIAVIEIRQGASSYTVSKDLAAAGLVADAGVFDTFLCNNGYAQSICVGTFEIRVGTSEEEIAKIITGKQ